MTQLRISEAARLVGRDRKTLYRAIRDGRLSATVDATGERQVDTSELVRVFGEFRGAGDSGATVSVPQRETDEATALKIRLAAAEAELFHMRERLHEKDAHLADLQLTVRLLSGPEHAQHRPWWKFWR